MHKQTWVKVNAPVDKGIKELVVALSAFPKLQTIESCQGEGEGAWVCFWYGDYWSEKPHKDLADFVLGYLAPRLHEELGDSIVISIRVDSAGIPQGDFTVRPGALPNTLKVLRSLAYERP